MEEDGHDRTSASEPRRMTTCVRVAGPAPGKDDISDRPMEPVSQLAQSFQEAASPWTL